MVRREDDTETSRDVSDRLPTDAPPGPQIGDDGILTRNELGRGLPSGKPLMEAFRTLSWAREPAHRSYSKIILSEQACEPLSSNPTSASVRLLLTEVEAHNGTS
ncbi:hypothetical protein BH23ACT6_BH23ACT6_04150 [soil metagenome]